MVDAGVSGHVGTGASPVLQACAPLPIDRQVNMTGPMAGLRAPSAPLVVVLFMAVARAVPQLGEAAALLTRICGRAPRALGARLTRPWVISDINDSKSPITSRKTLINIILASVSFVVLWLFGWMMRVLGDRHRNSKTTPLFRVASASRFPGAAMSIAHSARSALLRRC